MFYRRYDKGNYKKEFLGGSMKITEQELKGLKDLQIKQDQNAQVIGIATIEFFERVMNIIGKVQKTKEEQMNLGKLVLRAHGVDPDKIDCTIDMVDGYIKQLVVKDGVAQYAEISDSVEIKE
ncbi:MAG: hypothetical protein A2W05_07470 [Candidatus Schekmanbacteria bacterium RBG_16_38_10]|uniref:Uncharacterized protein n=1 Tax=Candidatus Schekmanbacteria bacterium RBG_16_38_10 TaxID=1817879 RepID=A0A1F7RVV3_9BACT|nr:MAG: hypothetical protein A2W05_07470 [Candidatus Schekmanbacteria bacterium RBG_16_38_10]